MSQIIKPSTGGGAIENLNGTYEPFGWATFQGTQITGAAAHTKGDWVQLAADTAEDWAGFDLSFGPMVSGSQRCGVDVSIDGGATVYAPNIFVMTGTAGRMSDVFIPLNVPAGSDVRVRMQTAGSAQTLWVAGRGRVRTSQSRPLFNIMEALNFDAATTYPDNVDLPLAGGWVELVASTANAYGALFPITGPSTAVHGVAQAIRASVAKGAAASEVEIDAFMTTGNTANPIVTTGNGRLIEQLIPVGTRLSGRAQATTPASDNIRMSIYGYR